MANLELEFSGLIHDNGMHIEAYVNGEYVGDLNTWLHDSGKIMATDDLEYLLGGDTGYAYRTFADAKRACLDAWGQYSSSQRVERLMHHGRTAVRDMAESV